jgi:hypothetical protein
MPSAAAQVFRAKRFFALAEFALAQQSFCSYHRALFFVRGAQVPCDATSLLESARVWERN